ncbi:PilN domain-containing protein [Psychrobacter sp.]|uniref:PilN domain-containing protein n=1 Tax=Psychrobacter sp. TaxID=56811 RepID=UPI0025D71B78|nr:PilN domain-containing protein [Psychrobacter sp.]
MATINLMPWREKRRLYKNKQFRLSLILTFIFSLLIVAGVWRNLDQAETQLVLANKKLSDKNTILAATLKTHQSSKQHQQQISAQLTEVTRLGRHRSSIGQLWSQLSSIIPKTMYLTAIVGQQEAIIFRGKASESKEVSKLVTYLQQNKRLQQAKLTYIKNSNAVGQSLSNSTRDSQNMANEVPLSSSNNPTNNSHYVDFEIKAMLFNQHAKSDFSSQSVNGNNGNNGNEASRLKNTENIEQISKENEADQ